MKRIFISAIALALFYFYSCKTKKTAVEVKAATTAKHDSVIAVIPVPTYKAEIKNLIDNACLPCHQSGMLPAIPPPPGGIALDNYTDVKKVATHKSFLGAINHEEGFAPMPADREKLDNATIQKITLWVQNGMPE